MARGGVRSSPATTSAAPTQPSRASRIPKRSSVSLFRDGSYVGEGRGSRAQRSTSFSHELGDAFQIFCCGLVASLASGRANGELEGALVPFVSLCLRAQLLGERFRRALEKTFAGERRECIRTL